MRNLKVNQVIAGALGAVGLSAALLLPMGQAKESSSPKRELRRVTTAVAVHGPARSRFRAHGIARAQKRAGLAFTQPGRLMVRPVRVGDRVAAGQLLARIDGRGYDHGARAAEASARMAAVQLSQSERDKARLDSLGDAKAISKDQVDRIGSAVDAARATRDATEVQLKEAQRALRETELRAPFPATVVSVHLEPGEFAAPGQPVVVLSGGDGLEVELDVPGRVAARLTLGAEAGLRFPLDGDRSFTAHVTSLGESAAGMGRLFPVIVAANAPMIRPGSAAEVIFDLLSESELTVPASAIVAPAGVDASVFRVKAGRAERVPVSLGQLAGSRVIVRGKLEPGDHVVTAGYTGLVDGEQVIEVERAKSEGAEP